MSHIVEAKTTITCPNLPAFLALARQRPAAVRGLPLIALLRAAMNLVAKEHRGTIKPYYLDYDHQRHPVNTGLALHIPRQPNRPASQTLERGLGMQIDEQTGVLTWIGDPYRVEQFYEQMQKAIIRHYVVLALQASLSLEHYQHITTTQIQTGALVLSGERYA